LQPGPHPSPLPLLLVPSEAPTAEAARDLVRNVQAALNQTGYYDGPLDGVAGPATRTGILAFERAAGRPQRGEATGEVLAAIRSWQPVRGFVPAPTDGTPPTLPDPEIVAAVQRALALAAYGQIASDGVLGPQTREAIMRFEQDRGLPPTGAISDVLLLELRAAGAMDAE
jgi:peptidoglycan hydrolase-like protein with peptidoglycan-binding domain